MNENVELETRWRFCNARCFRLQLARLEDYFHYVNWAGSIFVWLLAFRFLFVYDVIVVHFPIIMLSSSVNGV